MWGGIQGLHRASSAFPYPSATAVVCGTSGPLARAAETSAWSVWPLWWASTAPLAVGNLWLFSPLPSLLDFSATSTMGSTYGFLPSLLQLLLYPAPLLCFYSSLWCVFSMVDGMGIIPQLLCSARCWRRHLISLGHLQNWQCIFKNWTWREFQGCTDLCVVLSHGETGKITGKYCLWWSQKTNGLFSTQTERCGVCNAE